MCSLTNAIGVPLTSAPRSRGSAVLLRRAAKVDDARERAERQAPAMPRRRATAALCPQSVIVTNSTKMGTPLLAREGASTPAGNLVMPVDQLPHECAVSQGAIAGDLRRQG